MPRFIDVRPASLRVLELLILHGYTDGHLTGFISHLKGEKLGSCLSQVSMVNIGHNVNL